jgi:hypothetical protein
VLVDSEAIPAGRRLTYSRRGYPVTAEQVLQRFFGVSDREARMMVETEIGRRRPDDFEQQVKIATLRFYAGDLEAIAHVATPSRRSNCRNA